MIHPEHIRRFEVAVSSANVYQELWELALALRDEGVSQIDLWSLFERFFTATAGDDPLYDAIADTMDLIYGGPWAKGNGLYDSELTEDRIREERKKGSDANLAGTPHHDLMAA